MSEEHAAFIQFWIQMEPVRERLHERFAECASPCPDLSERIYMPDEGSLNTLLEVLMVAMYTDVQQGYLRDHLYERVMRKVNRFNSQGRWDLVRQVLQIPLYSEEKTFTFLAKYFSYSDIFGNLVPAMHRLSRAIRIVKWRPSTKVRRSQRKRGYDDKGTLLLPHEVHSAWRHSGPNPERVLHVHRPPQHPKEWFKGVNESGGSSCYHSHPEEDPGVIIQTNGEGKHSFPARPERLSE
jgi:hypothetical protein